MCKTRVPVAAIVLIAGAFTRAIGQVASAAPPPYHASFPVVSPDGKRVLFRAGNIRDPNGMSGYVMDADGSNWQASPVANGAVWFPDSKRALAAQGGSRTSAPRWVITNVDGTDAHEVPTNGKNIASAQVLPDGNTILFNVVVRDSLGRVTSSVPHTMNVDGSRLKPFPVPQIPGHIRAALVPSHDGRQIALVVADTSDSTALIRSTSIYVMNADGSESRKVVTLPGIGDLMSWSHDGRKIALGHDGVVRPRRAPPPMGNVRDQVIVVIDVATGAAQPITRHDRRYLDEAPSWSPDGHIYFHSNRDGAMEIYRMRADGSDLIRITK